MSRIKYYDEASGSYKYADTFPASGGGASSAEEVTYDNTESGLESENVQGAIDELAARPGGGGSADDVSYDNSASGLDSVDVQDAIDEVNLKSNSVLENGNAFSFGVDDDGNLILTATDEALTVFNFYVSNDGNLIMEYEEE